MTSRFISRLTGKTLALILAGGRGSQLNQLTLWRAKPAIPFGVKYRIIDFPLSNCINSGIRRVGVLTQYEAHSLVLHVQRAWSFVRSEFGEFVELLPAQQRLKASWYLGTADAVYQNLDIIRNHGPEYVIILAGDHIYKMDYGPMLAFHVKNEADITVGGIEVTPDRSRGFGIMTINENHRVLRFAEMPESMPEREDAALASMGIYVFSINFLEKMLVADAAQSASRHDFNHNIIPGAIGSHRVFAYPFRDVQTGKPGFWRDVGTVDAFWQSNMELIEVSPELDLYDQDWPIWTYHIQQPPAKFVVDADSRRGIAVDSMVADGCIVAGGYVRRSLLFSHVMVKTHARVENAVILPDVSIGQKCRLNNVVVDEGCRVPDETVIGVDPIADAERFFVTDNGVVLVTAEMFGQDRYHIR